MKKKFQKKQAAKKAIKGMEGEKAGTLRKKNFLLKLFED